jgi:hypothetical protein
MAYRGGALVKPVQVDYGAVAKIYSAGMARVQEIREGVLKERGEQTAALAKASDYVVTGIQDLDNLYMKAGQLARTRMQELIGMNDRGEISRSELTAAFARETSEASIISKMPEIMKKNIEEVDKDDNLSSLTKDQLTNVYLNDVNTRGSYVDGSGMRQDLKHTMDIQQIGGQKYMVANYEIYNPATKKTEVKSVVKPLKDAVNPNYVKWEKINDEHTVKKINNFSSMLGKRQFIGSDGKPIQYNLLQKMQDDYLGVRIEDINIFKNTVETHINSQDEKFWEAYAYEQMQVRAPWQSGYSGPLKQEKLDGMFNKMYYDKDGKLIEVNEKDDVLGFKFDEKGDISLKEETLKLAKAHYRSKVYSGLDINQEILRFKEGDDIPVVGGNDLSGAVYKKFQGGSSQDVSYDNDFFKTSVLNEYFKDSEFKTGEPIYDKQDQFNQDVASKGYSSLDLDIDGITGIDTNLSNIIKNTKAEFYGFNVPAKDKKSAKKLNDDLNVTSSKGLKYDSINSIIVVDGLDGNPQIFLSGNATASKKKGKREGDMDVEEETTTVNISNAISQPLSSQQITKLYQQIKNYPAFTKWVNQAGNEMYKKPEKAFDAIVEFAQDAF